MLLAEQMCPVLPRSLRWSGDEQSLLARLALSQHNRQTLHKVYQAADPMLSWADLSTAGKARGITACSGLRLLPAPYPGPCPASVRWQQKISRVPIPFADGRKVTRGKSTCVGYPVNPEESRMHTSLAVKTSI